MKCEQALVIAACDPETYGPLDGTGLGEADLIIAADSGVDTALRLGLPVDVVVGDLDSASSAGLDWARSIGARIEPHPAIKDETDLELALARAVAEAASVHVVASAQGRLDHALANLVVLASLRWAEAAISATIDGAHVDVVRGRRRLEGAAGDLLSLVAVGQPARVRAVGLKFPLDGSFLDPTTARGVSNVIVDPPPVVEVSTGVVLAIRPLVPSSDRGVAGG